MKKLTDENIYNNVLLKCEQVGCKLAYIEYNGRYSKIFLYNDNSNWSVTYIHFMTTKKCKSHYTKLTNIDIYNNVVLICELNKYSLIDIIYNGCYSKLKLKCSRNHEYNTNYNNFINKKNRCKKCSKIKLSNNDILTDIIHKCESKNYTLIEIKYNGCYSKLKIKCNTDNYIWKTNYSNFIHNDNNCKKCAGTIKKSDHNIYISILDKCNKYNFELIEIKYNGARSEITIKKDNKIINTNYYSFITKDNYTNEPKITSKLELKIKLELDKHNINYISQYKIDWLNQQSLDFYLYDYNIAIECQGLHHFEPVDFAGKGFEWSVKLYNENIIRDKTKYNLCKENNVQILYYTELLQYSDNYIDIVYTTVDDLLLVITGKKSHFLLNI